MPDFEIVPDSERPPARRGPKYTDLTLALLANQTVFVPGVRFTIGLNTLLRQGFTCHRIKGTRDGVQGWYVWVEKP